MKKDKITAILLAVIMVLSITGFGLPVFAGAATQSLTVTYSSTLTLEQQDGTDGADVGDITVSGPSGATDEDPYNDVDTSASPQDISSRLPVCTIRNGAGNPTYTIFLNVDDITDWSTYVGDERFEVTDDDIAPVGVPSGGTSLPLSTVVSSGVSVDEDDFKDLYLVYDLQGVGTATSTLTVLGQA
ncbi:MAG: hypothetical protein SVM80_05385 [Halobacteriota archaeon]|nr:hypothetical protein [Halobacteriota archaeon]